MFNQKQLISDISVLKPHVACDIPHLQSGGDEQRLVGYSGHLFYVENIVYGDFYIFFQALELPHALWVFRLYWRHGEVHSAASHSVRVQTLLMEEIIENKL